MPCKVGFATPLLLRVGVDSARERAVFSSSRFGVCTRHCDRFGNYKQRKKRDPMDGDRRRRTPLKSRHPDLKEKVRIVLLVLIFLIILFSFMQLRQCCLERIKEERNQLLWKIRSGRQQSQETEVCVYHINKMMQDIMESTLREIVSDELQKMQPCLVENERNIISKNNDVIWEFDGLHLENSTETASEELMLEMQRLLYEDLREELIRKGGPIFHVLSKYQAVPSVQSSIGLEHPERTERDFCYFMIHHLLITCWWNLCAELEFFEKEDEYLAQAVLENMNLNDNQNAENDKVWCPICKRGELRENRHTICCTNCNFRFDLGLDKVCLPTGPGIVVQLV
ncbi:hypothetical protein BHE74_00018473 [Ensete ventricosum]|nr:hypothetical protein BHE74_00018473 [Ensete ventricosum]